MDTICYEVNIESECVASNKEFCLSLFETF
jgi:hypothetical protein